MKKRPGKIVRTKSGKIGRTYSDEKLHFGKVRVYIMKEYELTGEKLMCDPESLVVVGYID
jgi:hypothetical protein